MESEKTFAHILEQEQLLEDARRAEIISRIAQQAFNEVAHKSAKDLMDYNEYQEYLNGISDTRD